MKTMRPFSPWRALPMAAAIVVGSLAGCGAPVAQFEQNLVFLRKQEIEGRVTFTRDQLQNAADITAALFGTPDEPLAPNVEGADFSAVLDARKLAMAAGPVRAYQPGLATGLYRQHCSHCHGVTGDGLGPTAAFLNPYPRDFRMGKYKFKSTPLGYRPTHDDLHKTLMEGISGTAMPAFKLLDSDQVDALVHYVKYLTIRGEFERELAMLLRDEVDENEVFLPLGLQQTDAGLFDERIAIIHETLGRISQRWNDAAANVTEIPARPEWTEDERLAAIEQGRALFYTTRANCFSCHGELSLGDGQMNDYDDWTKEIEPQNPENLRQFLAAGALPPRNILPRNLRQGVFRGGHRPIDLYWRVRNGIEGTPMPAAQLEPDETWALLEYVQSLQFDPFSRLSGSDVVPFQRERQ